MSLFGNFFNRKKQVGELEKDMSLKEIFEKEEDELLEDSSNDEGAVPVEEAELADIEAEDPNIEYEVVEREIHPAKIICPDCGGITLEGLDFCDKCGGELQ
ncbi:MAG: hypothetical protein K0R34_2326 [Herbinix sp.]|jgi:hypothetical protein|nr:hypothetical protein [Herbinix sp.]